MPENTFGSPVKVIFNSSELGVLLLVVVVSLSALFEIVARQDLADAYHKAVAIAENEEKARTERPEDSNDALMLAHLHAGQRRLRSLMVAGTTPNSPARFEIELLLHTTIFLREMPDGVGIPEGSRDHLGSMILPESQSEGAGVIERPAYYGVLSNLLFWFGSGPWSSSEKLLAVLCIGSGIIGAVVAGIRSKHVLSVRQFSLGFAAGFISYLVIKGGRYLLMAQLDDGPWVAFNPYGCSLICVMAGMFTQRAYDLLSAVVDHLIRQVEVAIKSGNQDSDQPPAAPPGPAPGDR